jgi:predicted RNA-binding Zn-ribbon protein involved in translation (DUF1610 family)
MSDSIKTGIAKKNYLALFECPLHPELLIPGEAKVDEEAVRFDAKCPECGCTWHYEITMNEVIA